MLVLHLTEEHFHKYLDWLRSSQNLCFGHLLLVNDESIVGEASQRRDLITTIPKRFQE